MRQSMREPLALAVLVRCASTGSQTSDLCGLRAKLWKRELENERATARPILLYDCVELRNYCLYSCFVAHASYNVCARHMMLSTPYLNSLSKS